MKKDRFLNRELSWLEFNQRVLNQALDRSVPLLERIKFLSITSSNLDEFFMVRVGGLHALVNENRTDKDATGLTPSELLHMVNMRTGRMVKEQCDCFRFELEPLLSQNGIRRIRPHELSEKQAKHSGRVFETDIYPVLSPVAIRDGEDFPVAAGRLMNVVVSLAPAKETPDKARYAILPIGRSLNRFVALPSEGEHNFILVEDLIRMFIGRFFVGETITGSAVFRIVRNADMMIREDFAPDFRIAIQTVLEARKRSDCVQLTVSDGISQGCLDCLKKGLDAEDRDVYQVPEPLDLSALMHFARLPGYQKLKDEPWPPLPHADAAGRENIFEILSEKDLLLYHPYDSFEPVVRFVNEAAEDPAVLAIKQILYRTSLNSPIVNALIRAAGNGKYVTAIVELTARFDEERNIERAAELQDAGVQVIYGVKGLKTHAKLCLVIRKEQEGVKRYMHFGTGNYNEITAQLYSDVSLMTCNDQLGAESAMFFNAVTGYSQPGESALLHAAPIDLRKHVLDLISVETKRARDGQRAAIRAKLNSLVDREIIDALYEAAQAGVQIRLNIRGICCLRPGVPGLSESISVISIVDRFLEHARVFCFHNGGTENVFISSADWMPRNLDRRVELMVPVLDPDCRARIVEILDTSLKDTANAWRLLPDGTYERVVPEGRKHPLRSQHVFYKQASDNNRMARRSRRTLFEPHCPPAEQQ